MAYKWKLRAQWAVLVLFLHDIYDIFTTAGLPKEVDVSLEQFGGLYPWQPPTPTLHINVSAWALVHLGREQVGQEIAKKLHEYEDGLKAKGLKEYPSRLNKHAAWWYQHYVKQVKYDEIAQTETYTPGGSTISYAKNVGSAVRKFSKLIGIDPQAPKE